MREQSRQVRQYTLLLAIQGGQENITQFLVHRETTNVNLQDFSEKTPLLTAIILGNLGVVKILLRQKDLDINQSGKPRWQSPYMRGRWGGARHHSHWPST